jgi:Tfp pilus assembly protein PilV
MSASKHPNIRQITENSQGFILLEVLVAMSMILGVWMSSLGAYQRLALNLVQQESKRSQLRKELDAFEMQEHGRVKFNSPSEVLRDDSNRMPSRNRSMRTTSQSTFKDKR